MRKTLKRLAAAGLLAPGISLALDAASDDALDTVMVYGVRLEQRVTEVGSSVTVITAADIEVLGMDFVADIVALAPGVTVNQNGAFGGSASVRIRGAASAQTLVIIDGVVVNDPTAPGGGFDFSRLDPANIDRIEVLRGPQSTLWGTDAIGGVVNIVTKRPEQGFGGRVFAEGGSYSTFRGGAEINGAGDGYDFRLSASGFTTVGISKADEANGNTENDGFDSTSVNGRAGFSLPGNVLLEGSFLWTDAESEFDSFSFGAQGNVGDGDEVSKTTELSSNVTLQVPLFEDKLENLFLVGYSDIERNNFSNGLPSFSSEGHRTTFRYQGNLSINDRHRVAFGAEREDSEANGEDTSINGLFALYELKPIEALTITAGLRRDDHESYGASTTGRLAVAYNPSDQVTLSGSWGEGFKAPTIFQTTFFCCGAVAPNAALKPETSEAYDVGIIMRTGNQRGEIGVTYFDQDTINLINFSFAVGGYENIAEAKSTGVEIFASYQLTDWAELAINYANIDSRDGIGAALPRVPRHSGNVMLTINPSGPFSGTLLVVYNGEEQDANGTVDAWTRIDLSARYKLTERVDLYARVENLLDEQYQQVLGYDTPGLSGSIGAALRF